jgi:hypothetical protein
MTNERNDLGNGFDEDPQLRALLARTDPARSLTPADPEGLARLLEDTMNDTTDVSGTTPARQRGALTWLAGAAAVAVLAGGGFALASSLGGDEPSRPQAGGAPSSPTDTGSPGSTDAPALEVMTLQAPALGAKCAVPTPEILAQFDTAFSGTVTAVDGDTVTLTPSEVFAGADAAEIEIVGSGIDPRALVGVVSFEVGDTYYVSASGGEVSVCGYSGPASDPQVSQLYDVAFR